MKKIKKVFDPENIIKLAIESGCNGVASTFGVLGLNARKYAHKIPFIVKINHNVSSKIGVDCSCGDIDALFGGEAASR